MMSTYNMDVEPGSRWLHVTPGASTGQPYYCTEVGSLAARAQFEAIRCAKDGYLLIRTRQGAGFVEQNEFQVLLEPGMALLLDCGLPQVFRAADGRTPWHFDFSHIEGPGVDTLDAVIRPNRRPGAQALPGAEYDELFEELLACAQQESAESAVRTGLAIHSLLAAMARQQLSLEADKPTRRLIERSAAYLREHCCEALNLDDILAGANMSRSYFMKLFRQYMGTTPYNYMLCFRITRAKELLSQTDLPVSTIARQTGFADDSNFSTRFAAMVGESPIRFRKNALRSK